ncbi:MAG: hypothetical protein SGJ19_22030 [Planctomycetia bacterium]|nr:hypothetical protein [Planctomycetia bacterium]
MAGFEDVDGTRINAALIVAVVGLLVPAAIVIVCAVVGWPANDIATIVGLFTSVAGTLVGAILGAQIGAAGKANAEEGKKIAEQGKERAQQLAQRALAALPPDTANAVLHASQV